MPTLLFEYGFIGHKGEIIRQPGSIKMLIVRDNRCKAVFAHTVPVKGIDAESLAVNAIADDVVWLGYTEVVLTTNNEPAILKLLQDSLRGLRIEGLDQVMYDKSPEYVPQSMRMRRSVSSWSKGWWARCARDWRGSWASESPDAVRL